LERELPKHRQKISNKTEERKAEHIQICLEEDVTSRNTTTGFEDIHLIHRALPEIDRGKINLSTALFDHIFSAPIIVEGMTGGTEEAFVINAAIAQAVEEAGLGMGVGSQRAAVEDASLERTFSIARKKAPNAFLIANLGAPQLMRGYGTREAQRAVDMIEADALAIHLNPLQEAVQPEGETDYAGITQKIEEIVDGVSVPVIAKETGAGIAGEEAKKLEAVGVKGIDVAGAGGTSWSAVEYYRGKKRRNERSQMLGEAFWDWGIPTAISLIEVAQSVSIPVIASGGIRSGDDIAKTVALGANLTGIALPVLPSAIKGPREVEKTLNAMIVQLRNVMFLVGADSIERLKALPVVLSGKTAEWLRFRGFRPEVYAKREKSRGN